MKKRVVLGMSGGVDSSVSAILLRDVGYDVIGLFMRNWHEEADGVCSAEDDFNDVRRVASALDIPYYTVDLSKQYLDRVFALFVSEYKAGRTPNPDVLCNKEIKFGPFKEHATKLGAEYIATGHYCGTKVVDGRTYLTRAKDENKDQTYFLNQVSEAQIENCLFPLANLLKPEVREIAKKHGLATADKKDSTGICFIGERNFRQFLSQYVPMKKGPIKTLDGRTVGEHNGVFYYTVGQRKGMGLGGSGNGEPYFVLKKDVATNTLYVNQGECEELFSTELTCENFNFITEKPKELRAGADGTARVQCRIRHRQPLVNATVDETSSGLIRIKFESPVRGVATGQYAVIYDNDVCLGGGVIR